MAPLAQGIVVLCIVVLSAVLVPTLLALRKTALRAESVLHAVEREIRPMVGQLESLTAEMRDLSRNANTEMKRISVIVSRVEDVSVKVSRTVGALSALTQIGQYAGVISGVRKGLNVFVRRLGTKR
jgi:uncharacterized protein YoxC